MSKYIYVYACGVDFQHEISDVPIEVYPSLESIKHKRECVQECGVVKLKVLLDKWVIKQNLFGDNDAS